MKYSEPPERTPNIVVVVLDDVGFGQLGCMGSPIATPNIDRLAANGLRYNRFHVTSICSSTRATLMTGRNHHAVGVGATQETSFDLPGYSGRLPKTAAALPRILRDNGYNTMCIGKWHLTPQAEYSAAGPFDRWPLGLGFERYYGFLGAETNHWSPELVRDNTPIEVPARTTQSDTYHLTDDLADQAVEMLRAQYHVAPDKPFFLWVATGAAHAPHHVAREWSDAYRGRFDEGWEALREGTYRRQLELGVIPSDTVLTPRPSWVPEWSGLSADEQRLYARYMEVFAGMLTHTDAQIGRILDEIDAQGRAEDTIVLVMSDNGTSSEGGPSGTLNEAASWLGDHSTVAEALAAIDEIGGPNHSNHYPWGWAWAGNSPFRLWKRYSWLGGVRAPLVVRWPAGVASPGTVRSQFLHSVDVAPTLLSCLGLTMPDVVDGIEQQRVDGRDASTTFVNPSAPEVRTTQYFEMHGSRSIYRDGWKATSNFVSPLFSERDHITGSHTYDTDVWELFDLTTDFSESTDRSAEHPELLAELQALWTSEAEANQVFPLFDPSAGYPAHPTEYPLPRSARYRPAEQPVAASRMPAMFGGFTLAARVEVGSDCHGVLGALGDHQGGWALHAVDGRIRFDVVYGHHRTHLTSSAPLAPGEHSVAVTMSAGDVRLWIDDIDVDHGRYDGLFMFPGVTTAAGGLWVGRHDGLEVDDSYRSPAIFSGTLHHLDIESGSPSAGLSFAATMRLGEASD
ncbi:MAG: sulfatase-like hydrolase/transferase [Ilumatobacteraceae bacterium]